MKEFTKVKQIESFKEMLILLGQGNVIFGEITCNYYSIKNEIEIYFKSSYRETAKEWDISYLRLEDVYNQNKGRIFLCQENELYWTTKIPIKGCICWVDNNFDGPSKYLNWDLILKYKEHFDNHNFIGLRGNYKYAKPITDEEYKEYFSIKK